MTNRRKSLSLAALQVAIVAGLGGRHLLDRAIQPRVWVKAVPADTRRGEAGPRSYLRLRIVVDAPSDLANADVSLRVQDQRLTAVRSVAPTGIRLRPDGVLEDPLAFYFPERANDPLPPPNEGELWAEVTVPKRGAPRPIRLGLKRGGVVAPL